MRVLLEFFVLIVAFFFFVLQSIVGVLFLPFILLLGVLRPPKREYQVTAPHSSDHHIHVPIQTVPPEYYEAYSLYLKSPEWKALRKLVLKRDSYRCVDCGIRDGRLSVHHLHYDGIETMTFTVDQCVSVCNHCHDIRHGRHLRKD